MPKMHDTLETTTTSLRPESSAAVVARRIFSIWSLIIRSFSIYLSDEGIYASGW